MPGEQEVGGGRSLQGCCPGKLLVVGDWEAGEGIRGWKSSASPLTVIGGLSLPAAQTPHTHPHLWFSRKPRGWTR